MVGNEYEIDLLQRIERFQSLRIVRSVTEKIFDDELQKLVNHSYHSDLHRYVKLHGYPIPDSYLTNSSYISREKLEDQISKLIKNFRNIIVLGCEGSGKTTLIHRAVGSPAIDLECLYIDTSDLEIESSKSFIDTIHHKFIHSISATFKDEDIQSFEEWASGNAKTNAIHRLLASIDKPLGFIENFLSWLSIERKKHFYVILDNIDSISIEAAKYLFAFLNQLHSAIDSRRQRFSEESSPCPNLMRYIVCCRTTTFQYINAVSHGLFINSPHELVLAEDDLKENLSVTELLRKFIKNENNDLYNQFRNQTIRIDVGRNITEELSFSQYVDLVCNWLNRSPHTFDDTVKWFCGRSIRRMKLFGLKILSSPIVARLAIHEQRKSVDFTRTETHYLTRRLYEALFDFSLNGKIGKAISFGFPMNPFRIVEDIDIFRKNPLIGVFAIDLLYSDFSKYQVEDVKFAKSIDAKNYLSDLMNISYSKEGILDLFTKLYLSGVIRPIRNSTVLEKGSSDFRDIHQFYIIDDNALKHYHKLIFCEDVYVSIQFYNAAVRARYDCGYNRLFDSFLYECFLSLIFLRDVVKRESQLQKLLSGSGVLLKSYTGRIRAPLLGRIIDNLERFELEDQKLKATGGRITDIHRELLDYSLDLLEHVKKEVGERGSFL